MDGWWIQLARRILSIRDNTTCWSGHRNYNLVVGPILLINKLVDVWGGIPPYNLLFLLFWATQFVDSGPFSNQHSVWLYRINKCCCWQHHFLRQTQNHQNPALQTQPQSFLRVILQNPTSLNSSQRRSKMRKHTTKRWFCDCQQQWILLMFWNR